MCIFAAVSASAKLQNVYHLQAYSANKNIIKNKKYDFAKIGRRMLEQINGENIKETYQIETGIELGRKLHEERVKWMKEEVKNNE